MALSVMTWNVENLFPRSAGDPQAEIDRYQAKLSLITNIIVASDPDIVAFQELGAGALVDLQALLPLYTDLHEGVPDRRGIRVGILSRLPFQDVPVDTTAFTGPPPIDSIPSLDNAGDPTQITAMGRGAARITVNVNGSNIHVITCHLKSKLLTFPGGRFSTTDENLRAQVAAVALLRRSAEAAQIRLDVNQLLEANPDDGVIVLGDFNDGPTAATTQIMYGPGGSEIGTRGFDTPDQGDAARLFNTESLIAPDRRFSRVHRGMGELLDQILASEELFPRSNGVNRDLPVVDSIVDFADQLPSIADNPNLRMQEIKPDHAPVVAVFSV